MRGFCILNTRSKIRSSLRRLFTSGNLNHGNRVFATAACFHRSAGVEIRGSTRPDRREEVLSDRVLPRPRSPARSWLPSCDQRQLSLHRSIELLTYDRLEIRTA